VILVWLCRRTTFYLPTPIPLRVGAPLCPFTPPHPTTHTPCPTPHYLTVLARHGQARMVRVTNSSVRRTTPAAGGTCSWTGDTLHTARCTAPLPILPHTARLHSIYRSTAAAATAASAPGTGLPTPSGQVHTFPVPSWTGLSQPNTHAHTRALHAAILRRCNITHVHAPAVADSVLPRCAGCATSPASFSYILTSRH